MSLVQYTTPFQQPGLPLLVCMARLANTLTYNTKHTLPILFTRAIVDHINLWFNKEQTFKTYMPFYTNVKYSSVCHLEQYDRLISKEMVLQNLALICDSSFTHFCLEKKM